MPLSRRSFLGQVAATTVASAINTLPAVAKAKRPAKVLLRSSWQTVNIGDIAHTPGMVRLIGEHLPEVEVTLWPASIGEPERAMLTKNFPKLRYAQTADEVKKAFAECDFLLHGSGPSLVAQKQVAQWKETTNKPYGVLGITLNSLDEPTRATLDGAKFVYFRDTLSLKFAKAKDLKCPVLEFAPDAAFAVNLRNDDLALPFLKKHGLEDGQFLCAIPKFRNTPYWLIYNRTMTDADKAKDAVNQKFKEHDLGMIREALLTFVRTTKKKVLLCPEDKSHMAIHKEMIFDKLPDDVKERFVWRPDYWITDEAVSVYVRSLGLLSMDMHSPIMAVANGIPAIHCRFEQQTTKGQMWNDIGLNDWLFDLDKEKDASNITNAVLAIAADPAVAKKTVAKAMTVVTKRFAEVMKTLAANLPQ